MKTSCFFLTLLAISLTALNTSSAQTSKTSAEKTIRDLFVAMDAGQTDKFDMYCAPDFKIMNPFLTEPSPIAAFKGILQTQKTAFPDIKHEIVEMVTDGKNVITKGVFKGTNTGSMMGNPPTGNKVVLPFLVFDKLNDQGKLVDRFVQFDSKAFEAQLMAGKISSEQIKKNCWAAYDALNRRDYDAFKKTVVADFVEYTAGPAPIKGVDACLEAYKQFFAMAPDMKFDLKNITVDGNKVFIESTVTGTNTGMVMGMLPATGKKVKTMDVDIITVNAQGLATSHSTANPNEFFHQIGYGSLTNPNVGVIMAAYAAFGKGDAAGIAALCDENVMWDCVENPSAKAARSFVGNKNIPAFFGDLMSELKVTKFEPTRFVADGDDVMVSISVEWMKNGDTKTMASPFYHHFKVQNGKVVWLKEVVGKTVAAASMAKK